ncbi:32 kDa beta-galactoside-binding lectin-like [Salminus brasiliensis]|uniref:32 kDa beta-galactoside-binding lectin-like n=1 Tax=Salminus brasiliensis TaxID=930266 RepID=UPI003B830305
MVYTGRGLLQPPEGATNRAFHQGSKLQMFCRNSNLMNGLRYMQDRRSVVELGLDWLGFFCNFTSTGNQVTVRNSKIRYSWGTEERELCSFPFTPGKPFEVKILCTDSEFRVEVDKKYLLSYSHRIKNFTQIRKLTVERDVFIKHVNIDPMPLWMTAPSAHVLNDVISENMSITIPGHIKPNAKVFTIDVMNNCDIFFQLQPHFSDDGKHWIVRNSFICNRWGSEETETPSFPFARGKPFLDLLRKLEHIRTGGGSGFRSPSFNLFSAETNQSVCDLNLSLS